MVWINEESLEVFNTENYKLATGPYYNFDVNEFSNMSCYRIVNKKTNVIEAQSFFLPHAIGLAKHLEESLAQGTKVATDFEVDYTPLIQ